MAQPSPALAAQINIVLGAFLKTRKARYLARIWTRNMARGWTPHEIHNELFVRLLKSPRFISKVLAAADDPERLRALVYSNARGHLLNLGPHRVHRIDQDTKWTSSVNLDEFAGPDPVSDTNQHQRLIALKKAELLPPRYRELVRLALNGLGTVALAKALGLSAKAVTQRLNTACRLLESIA
jgi:DNA-directed RNA polymerase specialized sigma24 family protein